MKNKRNKRLHIYPIPIYCLPCLTVFYKDNRDWVCEETKVCMMAREMSVSEICEVSCFSAS